MHAYIYIILDYTEYKKMLYIYNHTIYICIVMLQHKWPFFSSQGAPR